MLSKHKEKQEAIILRQSGLSIGNIAKRLKVSKSSVSIWVRDVALTDEMNKKNKHYQSLAAIAALRKASLQMAIDARAIRLEYQEIGREMAKNLGRDYAFGVALYFGEGSKNKNACILVNTDIELIDFFVQFLKKFFLIKNGDIRMKLVHYDNGELTLDEVTEHWIHKLNISGCKVGKATIKVGEPLKNKHPYGLCTIAVHRTDIVQKIYGSIRQFTNSSEVKFLG